MNSFSKKSPPGLQKAQKKTHNNPIPQFSFLIDNYLISLNSVGRQKPKSEAAAKPLIYFYADILFLTLKYTLFLYKFQTND